MNRRSFFKSLLGLIPLWFIPKASASWATEDFLKTASGTAEYYETGTIESIQSRSVTIPVWYKCGCAGFEQSPSITDPAGIYLDQYVRTKEPVNISTKCNSHYLEGLSTKGYHIRLGGNYCTCGLKHDWNTFVSYKVKYTASPVPPPAWKIKRLDKEESVV